MIINWRKGLAGFVGASKYAIKGVFSYAYSITSASPVSPDCIFQVTARISDATEQVRSVIDSNGQRIKAEIVDLQQVRADINDTVEQLRAKIDSNGQRVESRLCQ